MDVSSLAKLVPSTDGVIETNAAFKLFDNQLFAPDAFTFQQLPLAVSSPSLLAEPWQKLSAQAQQPSCGMSDDLTRELQRALEHRHSMLTTYKHLTADLWTQLQQVLDTSSQAVHQATANLQLLLDIDHTLVCSTFLSDAFDEKSGAHKFEDPDLQKFYHLAEQFWKWTDVALDAHDNDKPWPTWMPTAEVEGRAYTMWLPDATPACPHPMPMFITPVWAPDSTLTHYFCMYGRWDETAAATPGNKPKLTCMQSMSVIPAEITILAYIRYELAADIDSRRRHQATPSYQGADSSSSAGHTEVELRLASCGSRGYVAMVADMLQQVLGCVHGGKVFVEHAAFKHGGSYASCQGVKSLAPFTNLRHTGPGCICPRLVLDDHLMMWGLDPTKDAVRLMPTTSWKGRWPQPDRGDDDEDEQDAALAALAAQDAAEAAATTTSTASGDSACTAQASQQQQQPAPVVTYVSSPKPAAKLLPVHPQGLTVLLPEVLKLVTKELQEAEFKLPPIMPPPALPAHLLPKALADLQHSSSSVSDNSTCTAGTSRCIASAGSPLHGSPKTKKIVIRRKGLSPRHLDLGLGKGSPGGKRRRSSSEDEGSDGAGLGAAFDAVA